MTNYVIRFFVGNDVEDDFIQASDLADAVKQVHTKLTQPSFSISDPSGAATESLLPDQVTHLTIITLSAFKRLA